MVHYPVTHERCLERNSCHYSSIGGEHTNGNRLVRKTAYEMLVGSPQEDQEDLADVNLVEIREVGKLTKCNRTGILFELSQAIK